MVKGNVLVIGNSGVGKSMLINAVLGKECAKTGFGTTGTTTELEIYGGENTPFCIIDTVGFEPSLIKQFQAINAVKKWSKGSAKEGKEDKQINVIWFCIDGQACKIFADSIKNLSRATQMWPSVPVVAVITKSWSIPDRKKNIELVEKAFEKEKRYAKKLEGIIPVVAAPYPITEEIIVSPCGVTELIDITNKLLPEGMQAAQKDIAQFKLNRKRALAQAVVGVSTIGAAIIGAVPVPIPDTAILGPIEIAEIESIAAIYEVKKDEKSKDFLQKIIEVGTVGTVAKECLKILKAIPGINIGASVLNAVVAGGIVAGLGESSAMVFEKIYLGEKTLEDIEWLEKVLNSEITKKFADNASTVAGQITDKMDKESIARIVSEVFVGKSGN